MMQIARMLQGPYLSIIESRDADDFRKQVVRFTCSLGFDTVSAMAVVDHSLTNSAFFTVDNTPAAYLESYNDPAAYSRCPVMQHCKNSSIPIIWNQHTYVSQGQGPLWEEQARFGYKTGITLALHFPGDRHFCIGIDRDQALSESPRRLSRVVADLQLYAVHAQESAFQIFCPPAAEDGRSLGLTPRELEALRWTMTGKTAWEVGEALNISERTAVFHLQNAVRKLGCSGKYQAVLKAIRLGLMA